LGPELRGFSGGEVDDVFGGGAYEDFDLVV
jgi:hypothetical protein